MGGHGPDWEGRRREEIIAAATRRRARLTYALAALAVALVVSAGAWAYMSSVNGPGTPARPATMAVAEYNETAVSIELASVGRNATFYKYEPSGKAIRFLAVLGSDGEVRTAFDNAVCCYRRDLGERQEGDKMVCNWCNKPYPIDSLNTGNLNATTITQCCPANLPHEVAGGLVLIKKADLLSGAYMFKA